MNSLFQNRICLIYRIQGMDIEHRNGYRIQGIIYVYNLIDLKILYHQSHADEVARDGKTIQQQLNCRYII